MKKIIIIVLFIGVWCTSCQPDDIPVPTYSDVTWYGSAPLKANVNTNIAAGKVISIYDLSQGALSHEWEIKEGSYFLKDGFKNVSVAPYPDLTEFIDDSKGLVTDDKTVFVYFPVVGTYTVTLRNTFREKVVYNGTVPIEAVQQPDGTWLFEQSFTIVVF
ncbi:hypothetical protein [Flavobacterium fluviatile]|uniref:hypothetical protein n=1 Tax=Flavobacterium fluviatile TaxID=1862387 RepID=UPI0013D35282|nr:hypothetical protein [Flavobacterium fluviatile]